MKINDIKHNHSLTDLLKVGIFSILMFAPLIAIGSTCLYTIVNKNAYQSYEGTKLKEYIKDYNGFDNVTEHETYYVVQKTTNIGQGSDESNNCWYAKKVWFENTEYTDMRLGIYGTANSVPYIFARNINDLSTVVFSVRFSQEGMNTLSFEYISQNFTSNIVKSYIELYHEVPNPKYTLDNALYYATEKMTESDLFNWTQNTAIYTGVNAMCTQLEIETPVIPILIVYWFILTIIYVIIDIVLKCFTTLTHMLSKETH